MSKYIGGNLSAVLLGFLSTTPSWFVTYNPRVLVVEGRGVPYTQQPALGFWQPCFPILLNGVMYQKGYRCPNSLFPKPVTMWLFILESRWFINVYYEFDVIWYNMMNYTWTFVMIMPESKWYMIPHEVRKYIWIFEHNIFRSFWL